MRGTSIILALVVALLAPPEVARAEAPAPGGTVRLVLPAPTGHRPLGTVSLHLVDRSRVDPWVPAGNGRELMVQVWYPARDHRPGPPAPWVSPAMAARLAPPGSPLELPVTHARAGVPVAAGRFPVVLYSPGFGVERTASTAIVEELASHGYVVVTIDHTHDSPLVEFPGGRVALHAVPPPASPDDERRIIAKALAARVADTRFVLDRLAGIARGSNPDAEHRPLPRGLGGALDLERIGMFGHSLGGAAAAQLMHEDRRVDAGVNLDGSMSGAVLDAGLDRPFLLMSSDGHDRHTDESWTTFWAGLRGPRHELQLRASGHMSFTDYPVLLPQSGVPPQDLVADFGTIDGPRSVLVQRVYVLAFFDRYLRHRGGWLLAGPSARYPEMRFVP
jgi:predicted dienelactone hydrolase